MTLPFACTILLLVCIGYAFVVYLLQVSGFDKWLLPFMVAVGETIIIVFIFWLCGLEIAALVFLLNLVGGIPVTIGYYIHLYIQHRSGF